MATTRAFALNTGSTISGTQQVGYLAFPTGAVLPAGVDWWMGPDEDTGYIVAVPDLNVSQSTPAGINAGVKFWRSGEKTAASYLGIGNVVARRNGYLTPFNSAIDAMEWICNSGYTTTYAYEMDYYSFESNYTDWRNYLNTTLALETNVSDGTTVIPYALKVTTSPSGSPQPRCLFIPGAGFINNRIYKFDFKYYIPTSSSDAVVNIYYGNLIQGINGNNTRGVWTTVSFIAKLTSDINQYGQYMAEISIGRTVGQYIYLAEFRVTRVPYLNYV